MDDGYLVPAETLLRLGHGDLKAGRRALRLLIDLECSHTPINGPTAKPENVRVATEIDEPSIIDLLRLDVAENAAHIAPLSEARLWAFVQDATRDHRSTIGVIGAPGNVEAAIFLSPAQWFWSDDWFLEERLTVVAPAHRNSRHAANLLKFARWYTDSMTTGGYPTRLVGSVVATKDGAAKQALFGRSLNRIGSVYAYPDPTQPPSLR